MADELLDALRGLTGRPDSTFRDGQREAIEALVLARERVLLVQRTGWGKSAVYFLSTHMLRKNGFGPTLLISPLLALIRNQIEAAERLGLRTLTVNSASDTTVNELAAAVADDSVDLLLVSPERLANPEFANKVMPLVGRRPGLMVIDEAHCISDWGHDFRPDYRRLAQVIAGLGSGIPVLACTATANDRVVADVAHQLGSGIRVLRGPLARDGLALQVIDMPSAAERLAWLDQVLPTLPGTGIIYCLTVRDVERVTTWLRSHGHNVLGYTGGTDQDLRLDAEAALQRNEVKALVATTALGMGYDKPDLAFVIHFQSPGSPVGYYQQVGRAGRQLDDFDRRAAARRRGQRHPGLVHHHRVPMRRRMWMRCSPCSRFATGSGRRGAHLGAGQHAARRARQGAHRARGRGCAQPSQRLGIRADVEVVDLSDRTLRRGHRGSSPRAGADGGVRDRRPAVAWRSSPACSTIRPSATAGCATTARVVALRSVRSIPSLVAEAQRFIRRGYVVIEPRKRRGGKTLKEELRLEEGRALCMWNDAGWGAMVAYGSIGWSTSTIA